MQDNERTRMRRVFTEAWRKHRAGLPMDPLELLIAQTVQAHPEYHRLLEQADSVLDRDFQQATGESNPFLHLSMHLGLQEQISTDRPAGIAAVYRQLAARRGDAHSAEHAMMACLENALWEAQRSRQAPDEAAYSECLRRLLD